MLSIGLELFALAHVSSDLHTPLHINTFLRGQVKYIHVLPNNFFKLLLVLSLISCKKLDTVFVVVARNLLVRHLFFFLNNLRGRLGEAQRRLFGLRPGYT